MKATQKDFAAVAPRAVRQARVFFLCGPDDAGIEDAGHRLAALLDDPGERIELTGAELKRDPVRLGDEARSNSLFGGSRHLWLRVAGDEAYDAIENLLAGSAEPCPVLILASNASDKSRSAKLLSPRDDALVAMFYPPDLRSVSDAVRQMASAAGLKIGGDIAERIARSCNLDTRLAQSEITKLALYLDAAPQSPRSVEGAALDAVGARTEDDGFADVVNVVLGGEVARLTGELRRMRELGLNPVAVLLACERRAAQLLQLAAKLGSKGDIGALLATEKAARRVFWRDERDLDKQLRRWRGAGADRRPLERLVARLMALHIKMLGNSQSAELLLAEGLAEITRAPGRRGPVGPPKH